MDVEDSKTIGRIVCLVLGVICPPFGVLYAIMLLGEWFKGSKWYTEKDKLREERINNWLKEHLGVG